MHENTRDTNPNRLQAMMILAFSAVIALAGCTQEIDHISAFVMQTTQDLPWSEAFTLYHLPEPMDDYGFRPASILLMKLFAAVSGENLAMAPSWLIFIKGFSSSSLLGFAVFTWLRTHGFHIKTMLITISILISAPHLFSIWHLAELDGIGAAILLFASTNLSRKERSLKDNLTLAILFLLCATIKESIAISAFALLTIESISKWIQGDKSHSIFGLKWVGAFGLGWLVMVREMVFGGKVSRLGEAPMPYRLLIAEFTSLQFIYLVSLSGIALLLTAIACRLIGSPLMRAAIPVAACILVLCLPPMIGLNHYETIYFSPKWLALSSGALFLMALTAVIFIFRSRNSKHENIQLAAAYPLTALFVFLVVIFISNNIREDFASRLFLPVYPAILALIFTTAYQTRKSMPASRIGRAGSVGVFLLQLNMLWHISAHAVNSASERWSRDQVNWAGIQKLLSLELQDSLVMYNDFERELHPMFLIQLGGNSEKVRSNRYQYRPDHLDLNQFPLEGRPSLQTDQIQEKWIYWLGQRAEVRPEAVEKLRGIFDWKDFDYRSIDAEIEETMQLSPMRFQEDLRKTIYQASDSIQDGIHDQAELRWGMSISYYLWTPSFFEFPYRLFHGMPLLEKRTYHSKIWRYCTDCP